MDSDSQPARILLLRDRPELLPVVAERIWTAWWKEEGHEAETIVARLRQCMGSDTIPSTLVATRGGKFLGTVSLIENDLEERPAYTPWIAALWVEPDERRAGIGAALLSAALYHASSFGAREAYLCAGPEKASYYEERGWMAVERAVTGLDILVRPT